MIRELGEAIGDTVVESVGRAVGRTQEQRPLASDLLESDEDYLVVFDTPGAEAGDLQVRYEDGAVQVRVDRFRDFHEGFEMRFPGRGLSLDGSVSLPDDAAVDAESATATLKQNGTLQVRIPKVTEADRDEETTTVDVNGTTEEDESETAEGTDESESAGAAEDDE